MNSTTKARAVGTGRVAGGRNWPPQDPPMFWVAVLTLLAILVYIYLTLRSGGGRNPDYLVLRGLDGIKIVDLPHQKVTSVKDTVGPRHNGHLPATKPDFKVVGLIVSPAHTP